VNCVFRFDPRPLTTAIMASAIPAAIRPYSIAVDEGSLFVSVNCALDGYAASRISSCFGYSDGIMSVYRELLVSTLVLTQQKVPEARFVYRYDGDISKLLDVARPLAEYILSFSANLVGHADGLTDVQVMTVVTGADPT
jgi:hypothetical protein